MIQIGDALPTCRLYEFNSIESAGCPIGPLAMEVAAISAGKTVALFALPGAFTPTCSARHLPGYVEHAEALMAAGVDEIWCVAVNDAFVMDAWGRAHQASGRVRMLGDGNADFAKATGLVTDLNARGMGLRIQRCSMLVVDRVVRSLNVEAAGQFAVSDAATLLAQAISLKR